MLDGIWVIEAAPPTNAVALWDGYFPSGTRIKLEMQGPTHRAIEKEIPNLLGGTLTILPPFDKDFCKTRPGGSFFEKLCRNGKPLTENAPFTFNVELVFNRAKNVDYESGFLFYAEHGAKAGAKIVSIYIRFGADWQLWLKNPNLMVSRCFAALPGENNFESFPMFWRRQST